VALAELVQPAHLWVPDHIASAGPEAIEFAESIGLTLDAEQRLAVEALLAEKAGGRWAALEGVLIAARQNLKTFLFKVIVLADLYVFDTQFVVWTAHEFNTAMEAFRDCKEVIDGSPHLSRRVKRISEANGEEGIEFIGGKRLRFRARTRTGGRGLTGDRVILDEAFALQPSHMGSLMPTLSAKSISGNPQILYGSSAGLASSDVLRSLRMRGRAGNDPSLTYIEWCAPDQPCAHDECDHQVGSEGCALDDQELWRQANPALGRRIAIDFVAAERRSLPPTEFSRERLGWWEDPVIVTGFSLERWSECVDHDSGLADPVSFGVDVSPNSASAAIVACGGPVEVVEHRRGTSWVVPRLLELRDAHEPKTIGLDPTGPAGALVNEIEDSGLKVDFLDSKRSTLACAQLLDSVMERQFSHRDQRALNLAVVGARKRQAGDAWKWSRRDSDIDIAPLVAATIAHYLWSESKVEPSKALVSW
jgi:phage terminase large subunit-like protein